MRGIDSLLRIMVEQDAAELHLTPDQAPRLMKNGAELALTMPPMPVTTLQTLLGDLWSNHEADLRSSGRVTTSYLHGDLGSFELHLNSTNAGETFDVAFLRRATPPASPADPQAVRPTTSASASHELHTAAAQSEPLRALLASAVAAGASDVHLSEHAPVIVRVDGELRSLDGASPLDLADLAPSAEDQARVTAGESIDSSIEIEGVARARVHVYRSNEGLAAALRILSRKAPELRDLNMPVNLNWLVKLPHGLVIVCGPTGSGKSSTLAALARASMQQRAQILVSLEDPIEYRLEPGPAGGLVRQRQVGVDVPSFAAGLRDALREDPDVLLIGEMRDAETISLALTAAETGHLVFTSLHSRTAASAIERIVDTYPPERQRQIRVQLADALRVVVSQRLLSRRAAAGRVPALEILKNTGAVANLIREGKTAQIVSALQAGGEEGMLLLERCLADLVRAKAVDVDAAKDAANDLNTLKHYLGRI